MGTAPKLLLSLPPNMSQRLGACLPELAARTFATHDPPEAQLGSGGGTAHVLQQAWRDSRQSTFADWLRAEQKIVLHSGGESRRLPAYAAVGKLFIPMPVLRWSRGQRLGQTLLDLNEPFLREVFAQASDSSRVMIASGDVLLRSSDPMPALPEVDVVLLGMWAAPEVAQHYGVMFCDRHDTSQLVTFLQKPSPDEIRDRSRERPFLIDIGVWLLSERAVNCLMKKCGWDAEQQSFGANDLPSNDLPINYDLYGQWAPSLGTEPQTRDDEVSQLSVAVAPIHRGEFYHFGTTSDVIESLYTLQNLVADQSSLGAVPSLAQPKQFVQDAFFGAPLRRQENDALWVEGSYIPESWGLSQRHMLTGVPENDWQLELPEGICLDFVPLNDREVAVRPYGYADRFRGEITSERTKWLERTASDWFINRGMDWHEAGIPGGTDLQLAKLFPVLDKKAITKELLEWMIAATPAVHGPAAEAARETWLTARRLSAREVAQLADVEQIFAVRSQRRQEALPVMLKHGKQSIFSKLDLLDAAQTFAKSGARLPEPLDKESDLMVAVHDRMFRSEVLKQHNNSAWHEEETAAFELLAEAIVAPYRESAVVPRYELASDQIVWARSPARVDLAGGWTDTPPYCLEQGGSVVNIALNLNGQPPIQAFVRRSENLAISIRSIDLGIGQQLTTYEEVGNYRDINSGFTVAKAALCLCGFHPDFNGAKFDSLAEQLKAFGGGLDVTMLAAIPKGSGLGTSSILAGTVLGALRDICGYTWDRQALCARVSAVEQMLGSGGGWQDQVGGLFHGTKLVETSPGMSQEPSIRWLPTDFFTAEAYESRAMLYYTGITRVAHDVLGEIVRGMFLNDPQRLSVLAEIGSNSQRCFDAIQRFDLEAFAATIDRSWQCNQALDTGTNPDEVAAIVERIEPHVSAFKLAGAGGGGFMYLLAKDASHAAQLRSELESKPPNELARFVEMSISPTGLQVTRS